MSEKQNTQPPIRPCEGCGEPTEEGTECSSCNLYQMRSMEQALIGRCFGCRAPVPDGYRFSCAQCAEEQEFCPECYMPVYPHHVGRHLWFFRHPDRDADLFGSSGKWGGGTWFGAFRIPNLVPRSLVNIVGCSSRGRGNCGKLRATSNWASKPVIRSFPSAVRTVEKQLRALASSPPELLVFPRFA